MKLNITTFFFGSPYVGFSAFPPNYSSWVSGLDTKKSEFPFICKYSVEDNKTIFKYIEYNLSDNERSGRNFGVWLQIDNYKLKKDVEYEVLDFIKDFVNEILEEKEVFFKKGEKPHFYIIKSFKDVDTENILRIFNDEFINHFNDNFIPINNNDFIEKDLIVYDKPKQKKQQEVFIETDYPKKSVKPLESDSNKKSLKEVLLASLRFSASTIILLSLIFLSFIYSFWNNSISNQKINKLEQKINSFNIGSSHTVKPIEVTNDIVIKNESVEENKTNTTNKSDTPNMTDFANNDDRFFVFNNKLLFKKAVFIEQNKNASFSSFDVIVTQINKVLSGKDCKINSTFSIKPNKVKENLYLFNKGYLKELSSHIKDYKRKHNKNIPMSELKNYLTKDFIVLEK